MAMGDNNMAPVHASYVKMVVLSKAPLNYKNYYGAHPAYIKLGEVRDGVIIGFVRPDNLGPLPDHLAYCTPGEEAKIAQRKQINSRNITAQLPKAVEAVFGNKAKVGL